MRRLNNRGRSAGWLSAGAIFCVLLAACPGFGAEFGKVTGRVTDRNGKPIMGATVLLSAPAASTASGLLDGELSRAFTDARGRFTISRVTPGWYSLQVISPAKLPGFRSRVEVRPGTTTREAFTLGDIFSGIGWEHPVQDMQAWGKEWKWILRTSASTRPILRYRQAGHKRAAKHSPLPPAKRMIAMIPGTAGVEGLSQDQGTGTVVAYLHPLDVDSDVLVAGSLGQGGADGSSVIADFRRGFLGRNHEEISVAVHRMNMEGPGGGIPAQGGKGVPQARGMVLRYVQTRQISSALTLTAGFEMKYLNAAGDASTTQPEIDLDYQLDPATVVSFSYGADGLDQPGTLMQRIGGLNAFPRITLRNFHPRLESARHAEIRLQHDVRAGSSIEFAAYHDAFRDVAVWGIGGIQNLVGTSPAGDVFISPGGGHAVLNAGRYGSSGGEVAYQQSLGQHGEVGVMYAFGSSLAVDPSSLRGGIEVDAANLPDYLRSEFTQSVSGRFSTVVPGLKTQVINTYSWIPAGRLTLVDPFGESRMEFQPFWGLQIRQPLPRIDMLPMRIVAIADFRNLLGQGSVPFRQTDGRSVVLTPAYRTIRGGFSVQF